jgi:hypothetical protein
MCNIAHVKVVKSCNFYEKHKLFIIIFFILYNIHTYYFKLFNIYNFTRDRKTHIKIYKIDLLI